MAEVSGNPIVSKADCVAASYIKAQDIPYFGLSGITQGSVNQIFNNATLNTPTIVSGIANISTLSGINFTGISSASARTITAANSGPFAPLGFMGVLISGNLCVVPYFSP
jgi:hypothetical protein